MIHKILIVDDSPVARKMLKSCLPKDRELDIYEASNGEEGIEIFKKVTPDLTFLDLTMPVLDGYKTIPLLKQIDCDVVIIVLTADVQPKSISYLFYAFLKIRILPKCNSLLIRIILLNYL